MKARIFTITLLGALFGLVFSTASAQAADDIEVMEYNYSATNVISAFKNLTEQGEGLSVHLPGTVESWLSDEEFLQKIPFKSHIQGLARSSRSGPPLFFFGISSNHYHEEEDFYDIVTRPGIAVVQLGSRTESGERVRSNRLKKGTETTFTEGPPEDQVIKYIETEYMGHPSGMGMVGDILAVPNGEVRFFNITNWLDDDSENDGPIFQFSKKVIENKGNDEDDCNPYIPSKDGAHGSQAMGITRLPDGRFLLSFNGGACEPINFYWSNKTSFFDESGPSDFAFTDENGTPVSAYILNENGEGTAYVHVVDQVRNTDSTSIDIITVVITAPSYGDKETLTLKETGLDTGVFADESGDPYALLLFESDYSISWENDGFLKMISGEPLTVSYPFTFDPDVDPIAKYVGFDRAKLEEQLKDASGNQNFDYWPNKAFHDNKRSHQSVSLVVEGEGDTARVFIIGSSNSDPFSPVLGFEGSDNLYLLEVTNFQKGKEEDVKLTAIAKKTVNLRNSASWTDDGTYSFFEWDPEEQTVVPKIISKRWQGNLNAAGYAYVSPSGELLYYAAHHFADGPGHTIKMAELRHNHVVQDDSPKYSPGVNSGGPYEVDEGSTIILDGSLSQPASLAPWVHLFEHTNYGGRSIMVDYEDWSLDDYDDFGKLDGQCADLENLEFDLEGLIADKNSLVSQINDIASLSHDDLITEFRADNLCDWVCNRMLSGDGNYGARQICRGDNDVSGFPTGCNLLHSIKADFPDFINTDKRNNWLKMAAIFQPIITLSDGLISLVNDLENEECDPLSRDDLWNPPTLPSSWWVFDTSDSNYKGIFGIEATEFRYLITGTFNKFIGSLNLTTVINDVKSFFNFFTSLDNTVDGAIDDLDLYFNQLGEYIEDLYLSTQGFNDRASSVRWYAPTDIDIIVCDKALDGSDNCPGNSFKLEGTDFAEEIPNLKDDSIFGVVDWHDQIRSVKFDGTYVSSELVGYSWSIVSPLPPVPFSLVDETTVTPTFDATDGDGPLESKVELEVVDSVGKFSQASAIIQVLNVAPEVQIDRIKDQTGTSIDDFVPPFLLEAVEYVLYGSFTDAGILDTQTTDIDWGDGWTNTSGDGVMHDSDSFGGVIGTVTVSHIYGAKGTYPVTLTVEDKDGDSGQAVRNVQVADASDATQLSIDYLITLLEDPLLDDEAAESIRTALSKLQGNQDGVATNSALYFLNIGELNDALVKIEQVMIYLANAVEADPSLRDEMRFIQQLMTTVAKSVATKAVWKAETMVLSKNDERKIAKAYDLLSEGDNLQIAEDFVGAAHSYKEACKAVQGII